MKKNIYIIFLVILCIPALVYIAIFLYSTFHSYDRTFKANVDRFGWQIKFTEQEADSLLNFTLYQKRGKTCDSISLLIRNRYMEDVVSFLFVEGNDTLYIRKEKEFRELFPPEEQNQHLVAPPDFVVINPVVGKLPSKCKTVSYSDQRFFVYDRKKCTYIPKNNNIHVVTLTHLTERTNSYYLFDQTKNDTLEIKLDVSKN